MRKGSMRTFAPNLHPAVGKNERIGFSVFMYHFGLLARGHHLA